VPESFIIIIIIITIIIIYYNYSMANSCKQGNEAGGSIKGGAFLE
jgi:hypothetical protein